MFTLAYEWNEIEYVSMNEADFVFANEDPLIAVPSVEPLFLGCLYVKSMIPRSHGIWMNDTKKVMCYMQNVLHAIWYVICVNVMCCAKMWKVWWCMLFSWHNFPIPNLESSLTFLIQIRKPSKSQIGKSTDLTSKNHIVRKEIFFLMHVFGVLLLIPILSTSVY